jgi:hypothetical protein
MSKWLKSGVKLIGGTMDIQMSLWKGWKIKYYDGTEEHRWPKHPIHWIPAVKFASAKQGIVITRNFYSRGKNGAGIIDKSGVRGSRNLENPKEEEEYSFWKQITFFLIVLTI